MLKKQKDLREDILAKRTVKNRRIARRSVTLIVIAALLIAAVLSVKMIRLYKENQTLNRNIEAMEEHLEEAREENEALEEKRNHPLSEDEMIRIAREKLGLVFPNEIILIPEN